MSVTGTNTQVTSAAAPVSLPVEEKVQPEHPSRCFKACVMLPNMSGRYKFDGMDYLVR